MTRLTITELKDGKWSIERKYPSGDPTFVVVDDYFKMIHRVIKMLIAIGREPAVKKMEEHNKKNQKK
jgi:hypothetical protein